MRCKEISVDESQLADFCRRYGVAKLMLFGSVLRSDFDAHRSDVDVLVEFLPNATKSLFTLIEMERALTRLFGRSVDLNTPGSLSKYFRDEAIASAEFSMSQHDPLVRPRHMRDHSREAIEMLGNKTLEGLRDDRMLQLALVQLIEIIGVAASRVPEDFRNANPLVRWQLVADMRNKLIHGYDVIEYAIVFDTVRIDLPQPMANLDEMLGE